MEQARILYPVATMLLLTVVVAATMLAQRIAEMKARRIHPQKVATRSQMDGLMQRTQAADNFKNLFETPVFFYVLCLALLVLKQVDATALSLAWAYVAARVAHSAIHCTYNRVMHRLFAFVSSVTLLLVLWVRLVASLLAAGV